MPITEDTKKLKARVGKQAAKVLKSLPPNAEFAKAIIDECRANGVRIVKGQLPNTVAKQRKAASPVARQLAPLTKQADAFWRQVHIEKLGAIVDTAFAKARSQASIAKSRESIAKAQVKTAAAKALTASYKADIAEAKAKTEAENAELQRMTAEISEGIAIVTANYNAGAERVAAMEARKAAATQQRIANEEADWSAKAAATSDPILKQGYLERAELVAMGETSNDE